MTTTATTTTVAVDTAIAAHTAQHSAPTIALQAGAMLGAGAAYGKHGAISVGLRSGGWAADFAAGVVVGYKAKDAELAVRRDEFRAERAQRKLVALPRG